MGTVRGRLARARDLLRTRLTRRGLAVAVGVVSASRVPAEAAVSAALREATINAAVAFSTAGRSAIGQAPRRANLGLPRASIRRAVLLKLIARQVLVLGVIAAKRCHATQAVSDDRPVADRPKTQPFEVTRPAARGDDHSAIRAPGVASGRDIDAAGEAPPPKDVPIVWTIDGDRITGRSARRPATTACRNSRALR